MKIMISCSHTEYFYDSIQSQLKAHNLCVKWSIASTNLVFEKTPVTLSALTAVNFEFFLSPSRDKAEVIRQRSIGKVS